MHPPAAAEALIPVRTPVRPKTDSPASHLGPETRAFYLRSLDLLDTSGVRYLVGGAYSLAYHAAIVRHTKDLDVFVRREDFRRAMQVFGDAGYRTEVTHPHWLGKAYEANGSGDFIDVIFGSGNGLCAVDDDWFTFAVEGEVLGRSALLCPAEEVMWTKCFIQERVRFDGADVAHLIVAQGHHLDWGRILRRFAGHERVLLAHLVLFGYVYPSEKARVPEWVLDELTLRVRHEPVTDEPVCRGTNLSWEQYLVDLKERGFIDGRLPPHGRMSPEQIRVWTEAGK